MVYVYIRFKAVEGDFSFEPAKWRRILRGEVHYDHPMFLWLASRTKYCWLSEQRTSLNLGLRMNQIGKTVLKDLCDVFPGAVEVDTFDVIPGATPKPERVPDDVRLKAVTNLSGRTVILTRAA